MAGRLWHLMGHGLARLRWPLAGLAALMAVLACVLVVPQWLVRWELGASANRLTVADRAKAINDRRVTLLQGIGGAVVLLGVYFTYRQLQTSREAQVTERFTRAIDQLGHEQLDVRLGGIYALERIANDSSNDRATIAEVLTAFIRSHAPWPPTLPGQYLADSPIDQVPELQVRAPDVQAALTVLARRQSPPKPSGRLDLHPTDLRKVSLVSAHVRGVRLDEAFPFLRTEDAPGAQLQEAILSGVNLQAADLRGAQLQRALLDGANLQAADLRGANLQAANLDGAQLQGARLDRANLQRAILNLANLRGATLNSANLQHAILYDAQLQEASLHLAQLQEAHLESANLQGAMLGGANLGMAILDRAQLQRARLNGAQLQTTRLYDAQLQGAILDGANLREAFVYDAHLENAHADQKTTWPPGFDPRHAGVVLIDHGSDTEDELGS